jgi:sulfur relay (sulfurtransferase) complex TusBCD TusD component (DsrE family)
MKILMIMTDAPYGSEHLYNILRLAGSHAGKVSGCAVTADAAP